MKVTKYLTSYFLRNPTRYRICEKNAIFSLTDFIYDETGSYSGFPISKPYHRETIKITIIDAHGVPFSRTLFL